jgi:hypothetical protein
MPCTFIALFADAATAWRARDELSAVAGVDRAYEPDDVEATVEALNVTPLEARALCEGARRGERVVVVDLWGVDPTACEVLEAMSGANLLIRTDQSGESPPHSEEIYRPHPPMESIRSDMYIG